MIPVWLIAAIALLGAVCLALPLHIILLWIGVGAAYTALVVYVRSVVRQLRGVENTYNERK